HPRGTGEGCHVDEEIGPLLVGIVQCVGKNETALSIGVADLHAQPLAAPENVAGAEGIAGDGVFDSGDQHAKAKGKLRYHYHLGKGENIGGTAHVLLHDEHARCRLDVETAGVETNSLADKGDGRRTPRPPAQVDQARRTLRRGRPADGMDHREAGYERLAGNAGDAGTILPRHRPNRGFELAGTQVARWRVDEIAGEIDGLSLADE